MACRTLFIAILALAAAGAAPESDMQPGLRLLLQRELKFSPSDLADLEKGKVVSHGLRAFGAGEIAAVGAVRVKAPRRRFVDAYRDIEHFKRGPDVVQIGRFGNPPVLGDLAPLTLDKQDVDLRDCRVGHCDIRLPSPIIARFQREIDWKDPDAQARAAALFKQVLFDHVRAYLSGGPERIVQYDDEKRTVRPVDDFAALLKNSPYIDALVPGLADQLRSLPSKQLTGAEDFLYWSKEKFGLTPFVSVTHVTIAPPTSTTTVIASKDVYSSRYFDASLAITIASDSVRSPDTMYLVYVNRSRANALKGPMAGLRRAVVERRANGSLEENLKDVRLRLERSR